MGHAQRSGGRRLFDGSAPETPRATDLLRAEKLATEAEKRLQLPARRAPGWRRGGAGWDEPGDRKSVV